MSLIFRSEDSPGQPTYTMPPPVSFIPHAAPFHSDPQQVHKATEKHLKTVLMTEFGLDRDFIRKMVKDIIEDVVHKEVARLLAIPKHSMDGGALGALLDRAVAKAIGGANLTPAEIKVRIAESVEREVGKYIRAEVRKIMDQQTLF